MAIPMYPSLSSHAGALTDPKEIVPSLLRQIFAAPSTISDTYEGYDWNYKLSFRRLMAKYGHDPEVFCTKYQEELSHILGRYFPDKQFYTRVDYKYINDRTGDLETPTQENRYWTRYTVFLDIQERLEDQSLSPVIVSDMVEINSKTFEFKINFRGMRDARRR